MKKYLLIVACALLASFTVKAAKAGGECGDDGDPVYWSLSDDGTTLTITGEGYIIDVESPDESPWYQYRADITTVEIGANIVWLEGIVFAGCDKLTTFKVDSKNTSLREENGFILREWTVNNVKRAEVCAYAPGLTGACVVPEYAEDLIEEACYGCNMSSVTIKGKTGANWRSFAYCPKLTAFNILYEADFIRLFGPFYGTSDHCIIYVPSKLLSTYKSTYADYGWTFAAYEEPTGINDVNAASASKARKFVKDGQIVIEKDGKQYNAAGAEIK